MTAAAAGAAEIELAGERVALLPSRTLWWPAAGVLFAADLHLGKSETMAAAGLPLNGSVSGGIRGHDLERLARAVEATGARRLVVLGDLVHAPAGVTEELLGCFGAWLTARRAAGLESFTLVPGNHDLGLRRGAWDAVMDAWGPDVLEPGTVLGPFCLAHEPSLCDGAHTLCGHVHPAINIGAGNAPHKLPAFLVGEAVTILPAFSAFTGGKSIGRGERERLYVIADDQVVAL